MRTILFSFVLFLSPFLCGDWTAPLVQTGTIPLATEANDILFYGGYLYGVSRDALTVYDLVGGTPVLKATIPIEHSEILPRLYRYKTTLILSYFNDYTDNGLRLYDITNPLQPALLYVFRPKGYPHYGHINSGFNSECRGTCKVIQDTILCPMNMGDEDPCTDGRYYWAFALSIPDRTSIILIPSGGDYNYIYGAMSIEYYAGIAFFQEGQGYCPFWIQPIIDALDSGLEWTYFPMYCTSFCEGCPIDPLARYKQWVFYGIGWEDIMLSKMYLEAPIGGEWVFAPYDEICQAYNPAHIHREQVIAGHENWIYGTSADCRWVSNFDPGEEYPFSGVNVMSQPLYGMAIVNDVIYASGGDTLYTFDPVNHDLHYPQGTVNVKEGGTLLTFYGTAVDDDDIRGVYLRVDDEWMKGEEYEEPFHPEYFEDVPVRRHQNPVTGPVRWEVTLDRNDLTPGTHTVRIIAVDFEGSFAVIGEKEIIIGAEGKAKKRNPGGGGR